MEIQGYALVFHEWLPKAEEGRETKLEVLGKQICQLLSCSKISCMARDADKFGTCFTIKALSIIGKPDGGKKWLAELQGSTEHLAFDLIGFWISLLLLVQPFIVYLSGRP